MATTKQDKDGIQSEVHHRAHAQDSLLPSSEEHPQASKERGKVSIKKEAVAWQGFVLVIISCLCSAVNAMTIKMLAGRISTIEVAVFRQFSLIAYLSPPLAFYKISMRIEVKHVPFVGLWIVSSTVSVCCAYYSLEHISAGDAAAIVFSTPIFTGIIAWLFLREKLTLLDALFVLLTIVGIVLIARPSFIFVGLHIPHQGNMALGVTVALASTLCESLATVILRKLGRTDIHPFYQLWVFGIAGGILISIVATLMDVWKMPRCGMERIIFIVSGFLSCAAYIPILYALNIEKAVNVALFRTNIVIFTIILEFAIFGTVPFYLSLIGTGLIIFSSLGTTMKRWNAANRIKQKSAEQLHDNNDSDSDNDNETNDVDSSANEARHS